jgi:putative transposase
MPLLTNDPWLEMLARAVDAGMERHNWRLTAFVLMREHVHLLVFPLQRASKMDALLKAVKRPYSFRVKQCLIAHASPLLQRLTIRQRP